MSDPNFSAIRARLRYETIEDFIEGYSRFISGGGMFIPMRPSNLKPIGTTIRFQFLLGDGSTAMLGEGVVLQVRQPDESNPKTPVGMLVKFTKLSQESKVLVDRILREKNAALSGQTKQPEQKHPTKPFPEGEEAAAGDASADSTKESHRHIVAAAQVAAAKALGDQESSPGVSESDATPMPSQPSPELEAEAYGGREPVHTPIVSNEPETSVADDTGVTANDVLDALLAEESEAEAPAPEPEHDPEPETASVQVDHNDAMFDEPSEPAAEPEEPEAQAPAAESDEFEFDLGFETPEPTLPTEPEAESEPEPEPELEPEAENILDLGDFDLDEPEAQDPPTAEAPESKIEPATAEAPEPATAEVSADQLVAAEPEVGLGEPSVAKQPQQLGQTAGGVQILAFDDMTEDAMKELEDFSFVAEEDDIDGMFDGLFGSSEAEDDFFGAFGGSSSKATDTGDAMSSVEFELPSEDELEDDVADEPEQNDPALDEALEAAILGEPEDDFGAEGNELSLEDAFSSPVLSEESEHLSVGSEMILDPDDASFVSEESELGDESSPVLDLAEEADEEDILLDQALSFHGNVGAEPPSIEENDELDSLLGHLDDDPEDDHDFSIHLTAGGIEPEPEEEEEPYADTEYADEESLEFLLASAKKTIEEKQDSDEGGDIIDQMFGDDELPPPPVDAPSFDLPPATSKRKKGLMSKLFGKD